MVGKVAPMTEIDIFGFPIPLEWFIPITIWLMITTYLSVQYFLKANKKTQIKTYAVEFDKTGLADQPPVVLKPEQEELTRLKYHMGGKDREVSKFQPLTIQNRKTKIYERLFIIPKDSDQAWNPETAFTEAMKTKSPSRMMQEFAVWLGNIRGMLSPGFSIRKNLFLLVAWGGMMFLMGVFFTNYVFPELVRNYHG
jgi:hypothetical protein